jgi:molybdate transport system substrate-binding protein
MKKLSTYLLFAIVSVCTFAPMARAGNVTLSAAASLKEVITELIDGFARKNPGTRFVKNFGGSGTLARQIESGAPVDIFIPANTEWMEYLHNRKLMNGTSIGTFAYNTLVFAGNPARKVRGLQDLSGLDRIAIGSPKSVPAGEYAAEAFRKAGIERQLEKKLIIAKDVRESLMYAERGEVDGAFVYRTDALQARKAKILFTVPQELYPRVTYPMGLTATGAGNRDAEAFYRYLQGKDAKAVLLRYGFVLQ